MIGTATLRQIAGAAVVSVVVALILALLPGFAGGRGDAHEDAYDGGRVSLVGPSDSGLDGAGDLARRVRAAAFPDGGADYDDLGNLARSLARPASHRSAPKTQRLLTRTDRVEEHLARLDHSPTNDAMLARIRSAATEGTPLSRADRALLRHESTEAWLMDRGVGYGTAHRVAGWTHRTYGNYDPSVIKQFPEHFGSGWKHFSGIE